VKDVKKNKNQSGLRILHLSDTHNLHRTIEMSYPLPAADILLHTGDISNHGTDQELIDFNLWLGELSQRYANIIVILGNHDLRSGVDNEIVRAYLSNATVLFHEQIEVLGLKIYGLPWSIDQPCGRPDNAGCSSEIFGNIPNDIDILMTHGPPFGIFDKIGDKISWGSSDLLRMEIQQKRPKVHLFGHLHEQRGVWIKDEFNTYKGGVEFEPWPYPNYPPSNDYPCQIISCNAMRNHGNWDNKKRCIAGPARLIYAVKDTSGNWTFSTS